MGIAPYFVQQKSIYCVDFPLFSVVMYMFNRHVFVDACGLADQCWIHKQKVVGSSPVTVNVLCPWVRHLTIITPLYPGV